MEFSEQPTACGVCDAETDDLVGYVATLTVWEYLADRFDTAFPSAALRIGMCESCHADLAPLAVEAWELPGEPEQRKQNMEALEPILDDLPPAAMYVESETGERQPED